jgi:hypothetical protein
MTIGIFKEWLVKYFFVHKIVFKAKHSRLMFKKQIRSNISVPPPILPWVEENTTYSIVNFETWQVT